MADDQWISIVDYLQTNRGFHDKNFTAIHQKYKQECGETFPPLRNESALHAVTSQLKIKIDGEEDMDLLYECVISANEDEARRVVKSTLDNLKRTMNTTTISGANLTSSTKTITRKPTESKIEVVLYMINSKEILKMTDKR